MPVQVFSTLSELLAYISTEIGPNGTQNITGQRHREVLQSVAQSIVSILYAVPPNTVYEYPAWSNSTTYPGGIETIVRHEDKLWLFVSSTNQTGPEPGTNGLVWQELSTIQLAHIAGRDRWLDQFGPNAVSALELRQHLDGPPVAASLPAVLDVGNDAPDNGATFGVLTHPIWAQSPFVASELELPLATRRHMAVGVHADLAILLQSLPTDRIGEYTVRLDAGAPGGVGGTGTFALTWFDGAVVEAPIGVTLPETIETGQSYAIHFRVAGDIVTIDRVIQYA